MDKQCYKLLTSCNEALNITAYGSSNNLNNCIIYIHGFKGFKDWGFVPYLSEYLAERDFFVLTFNFSHNGIGENPFEFIELEKFAKNTFSREVNELTELIDAYLSGFFGKVNNSKIGLLGHSRGGAISLLAAKNRKEISTIILWASIARLDRYSNRQKNEWKKKGFIEIINQRTGQEMKLDLSILNDIEDNSESSLNIENAVKGFNKPLLIVHGEHDLSVPIQEAEELYNWSNKELTEFYKIPFTGHTFDIKHPFEGSNKNFDDLLEKTNSFFKKQFN